MSKFMIAKDTYGNHNMWKIRLIYRNMWSVRLIKYKHWKHHRNPRKYSKYICKPFNNSETPSVGSKLSKQWSKGKSSHSSWLGGVPCLSIPLVSSKDLVSSKALGKGQTFRNEFSRFEF